MCVCACLCMRACVHVCACVRVCVCACLCVRRVHVYVCKHFTLFCISIEMTDTYIQNLGIVVKMKKAY